MAFRLAGRSQAIIEMNAGILLIKSLVPKSREILIVIRTILFKKIYFNVSSSQWRPTSLGLNVLITTLR